MKTNVVRLGSLVIAVGLILLGLAFLQMIMSGEQWDLATSQVLQNNNSFTAYLVPGYYRISAAGGEAAFPHTGDPPILQITNGDLDNLDARTLLEGQYMYFTINSSDTYSFYIVNWYPMANNPMTVGIDLRTYKISYLDSPYASVGVVVFFAGLGLAIYGFAAGSPRNREHSITQ